MRKFSQHLSVAAALVVSTWSLPPRAGAAVPTPSGEVLPESIVTMHTVEGSVSNFSGTVSQPLSPVPVSPRFVLRPAEVLTAAAPPFLATADAVSGIGPLEFFEFGAPDVGVPDFPVGTFLLEQTVGTTLTGLAVEPQTGTADFRSVVEVTIPTLPEGVSLLWYHRLLADSVVVTDESTEVEVRTALVENVTRGETLLDAGGETFSEGSRLLDLAAGDVVRFSLDARASATAPIGTGKFAVANVVFDNGLGLVFTPTPGDFTGDGLINDTDRLEWAARYGQGGSFLADGNGNGVIDAADYTVWRDAHDAAPLAVPEPAIGWMLLGVAIAVFARR